MELATRIAMNMAQSRRTPVHALAAALDVLFAELNAAKRVAARAAEWELRATKAEQQLEGKP